MEVKPALLVRRLLAGISEAFGTAAAGMSDMEAAGATQGQIRLWKAINYVDADSPGTCVVH